MREIVKSLQDLDKIVESSKISLQNLKEELDKEKRTSEILMEDSLIDQVVVEEEATLQKPSKMDYAIKILELTKQIIELQKKSQLFEVNIKVKLEEIEKRYLAIVSELQYKQKNLEEKTKVILKSLEVYKDTIRNLLFTLQAFPNNSTEIIQYKLVLVDKINENLKLISEIIFKYLEI